MLNIMWWFGITAIKRVKCRCIRRINVKFSYLKKLRINNLTLFILVGVHNCPDGWVTYKDHCYQINAHPNQQTTWSNARRMCLDFNKPWKDKIDVAKADLVSITSADEQAFLESQYRNLKVYRGYFWTGLYKNNSKPFAWTDHSDFTYQNWKNGKPDASKNCSKSSLSYSSQGWEASLCTENNYFVCKVKRGKLLG